MIRLMVTARDWSPPAARRRGVIGLAEVLRARSLDASTALELLRRAGVTTRLVELLYEEGALAAASAGGSVSPDPAITSNV